jgi:plasmid stability protein
MRTTLTLDDDVAAKLKTEARRTGLSFRDTVNDTLRRGLLAKRESTPAGRFCVEARDLGDLRPGINLDNVAEVLEQIEGPLHR